MPFLLVGLGLIMVTTGLRDTQGQLAAQLRTDFTGQQNFTVWLLAIGSVGALGYVSEFQAFSRWFLALIIIAMVLSNKGFFQKFSEQFNAGPLFSSSPASPSTTASPAATLEQHQSGAFGQTPTDPGQAKFNGWANYFLGGGWLK